MCTVAAASGAAVAAASGAASVRVWQTTSGGRRPAAGRSPPERANVDYAPSLTFSASCDIEGTRSQ
jgi:hypothetical protein